MNIIYQNPFRILGVPITATEKDIARRINELTVYYDLGKEVKYDSDNYFKVRPIRTPTTIKESLQKIEQPFNKIYYAFFGFYENPNNAIDKIAFEELKNGNSIKALELWEKSISSGAPLKNNLDLHNIVILLFNLSFKDNVLNKNYLKSALKLSCNLIKDSYIKEFCSLLSIKIHSEDLIIIKERYVKEVYSLMEPFIQNGCSMNYLSYNEMFSAFNYFPDSIIHFIKHNITDKYIFRINNNIDIIFKMADKDDNDLYENGKLLYDNTKKDIANLANIFSNKDLEYSQISDKISRELKEYAIKYYNKNINSGIDPSKKTLELLEYSKKLAIGSELKSSIIESISIIQKNTDRKPLDEIIIPFIEKIEIFKKNQNAMYLLKAKEILEFTQHFVFDNKPNLDRLREVLNDNNFDDYKEEIKILISNYALLIANTAIELANRANSIFSSISSEGYGKAIEIIDMARRILLYDDSLGNLICINNEMLSHIKKNRKIISRNITNSNGLIIKGIGGVIRSSKGRKLCGCGSGKPYKECCSI